MIILKYIIDLYYIILCTIISQSISIISLTINQYRIVIQNDFFNIFIIYRVWSVLNLSFLYLKFQYYIL